MSLTKDTMTINPVSDRRDAHEFKLGLIEKLMNKLDESEFRQNVMNENGRATVEVLPGCVVHLKEGRSAYESTFEIKDY
jgi:hypothetical protein